MVDGDRSVEEIALAVAHAAHHAKSEQSGAAANVDRDARAEYVDKMLEEEAGAVAAAIELKEELEADGRTIAVRVPLEAEYEAAFGAATARLRESKRSMSDEERVSAGRAAAREAVRRAIAEGEVAVIGTVEAPRSYYGRAWDARRRARGSRDGDAPGGPGPQAEEQRHVDEK